MNKIRQISLISSLIVIMFLLNSCADDDGYDSNPFKLDLATVNLIDSLKDSYYLTLNDGTTLWPAISKVNYKPTNNQRVLVNYTILADSSALYTHNVRINGISNILTKEVQKETPDNSSQFGSDPINIITIGIGDNFLNIRFGIQVGGGQIKHTISLVTKDLQLSNDTITLGLRHNANNDAQRYEDKSYAAFDLRPLQIKNKNSVYLRIEAEDYSNNLQEYILQYKY